MDRQTALYRLFDARDVLMYVGISTDPRHRFHQHATDKAWWPEVTTREITWYDTRREAEAAEVLAIRVESPMYNTAGGVERTDEQMPRRVIRISKPLWQQFGHVVGHGNRSRVLRDFLRWYARVPGAELPKRPDPDAGA